MSSKSQKLRKIIQYIWYTNLEKFMSVCLNYTIIMGTLVMIGVKKCRGKSICPICFSKTNFELMVIRENVHGLHVGENVHGHNLVN